MSRFNTVVGCTSAAIRCHQIKVNYTRLPYEEFVAKPQGSVPWDVADTEFFVNTEGCGYPPTVNCSAFAKKYAYENMGKIFPCYYSRTHPETVVARYDRLDNDSNSPRYQLQHKRSCISAVITSEYRGLWMIRRFLIGTEYNLSYIRRYSWDENLRHLVLALIVPIVLFAATLGVLCYWYCPPMGKTCGGPGRNLIDKYARKEE